MRIKAFCAFCLLCYVSTIPVWGCPMVDFSNLGQHEMNPDQPTVYQGGKTTQLNPPERIPASGSNGEEIVENPYIASIRQMAEQNKLPSISVSNQTSDECIPMLSIWFHPRRTAREILNDSSYLWVPALAIMYGITSTMSSFFINGAGELLSLANLVKTCLIFGTISSLLSLYYISFLLSISSWILGGQTGFLGINKVFAWSCIPTLFTGAIIFGLLPLMGPELMSSTGTDNSILMYTQLTLMVIAVITYIWALVVFWGAFAEAQDFSFLRTLGCFLLTGLFHIGLILLLTHLLKITIISIQGLPFDG